MNGNKNILVFLEQFYPAHKNGGPLLSISNILNLGYIGKNFKIITEAGKTGGTKVGEWLQYGQFFVFTSNNFLDYIKAVKRYSCSVAYLNSLFNFKYSVLIIILNKLRILEFRNILLAPRGELSEGALSLKSI